MDLHTLLTGVLVFAIRIVDVSLGTIRTISTVQGRTKAAFLLGFVEVSMWLAVIATIVNRVAESPILGVFYALGFSTGNVVGILLERRLAFGHVALRIITSKRAEELARAIRKTGQAVTCFEGRGGSGTVTELCTVCRRRDLKQLLSIVGDMTPKAFYMTEPVGTLRPVRGATMQPPTGWRAIMKRK